MQIWSDEERQRVVSLRDDNDMSWNEIGELMDKTAESARKGYMRAKLKDRMDALDNDESPFLLPFDSNKSHMSWEQRLDIAEMAQTSRQCDDITVQIAKRTIITDRPIGVWFTGDLHLGSVGSVTKMWRKHMRKFMEIDGLVSFLMGDYIANIAQHRNVLPIFSQVMTPEEQGLMLVDLLDEMQEANKILAVILSEEHDQRDARHTGVSFLRQLLRPKENAIPFLDNRGALILEVGPDKNHLVPYVIYATHKSRFYSFLNELHSPNRIARLEVPANVIACAHTHRPAMGKYNWFQPLRNIMEFAGEKLKLGGEIFCVQCGTYERDAQYGNQTYGWLPDPEVQILVFDPHQHHIEMATSFSECEKLL